MRADSGLEAAPRAGKQPSLLHGVTRLCPAPEGSPWGSAGGSHSAATTLNPLRASGGVHLEGSAVAGLSTVTPTVPVQGDSSPTVPRCQHSNPDTCSVPRQHQQPYFFPITKTTATQQRGLGGDPVATAHPSPRRSAEHVLLLLAPGTAQESLHISRSRQGKLTSTKPNISQTCSAQHAAQTLQLCALTAPENLPFPPKPCPGNAPWPSPGLALASGLPRAACPGIGFGRKEAERVARRRVTFAFRGS